MRIDINIAFSKPCPILAALSLTTGLLGAVVGGGLSFSGNFSNQNMTREWAYLSSALVPVSRIM